MNFFKPVMKGGQAVGYGIGTVCLTPLALSVCLVDCTVILAAMSLKLDILMPIAEALTSTSYAMSASAKFCAHKTEHKMQRALGHDGHYDKSQKVSFRP